MRRQTATRSAIWAALRSALTLLPIVLCCHGCGWNVVVQTRRAPAWRLELEALEGTFANGGPLSVNQKERLATLLSFEGGAGDRADVVDATRTDAVALRSRALFLRRHVQPGWIEATKRAIAADPVHPGTVALGALLIAEGQPPDLPRMHPELRALVARSRGRNISSQTALSWPTHWRLGGVATTWPGHAFDGPVTPKLDAGADLSGLGARIWLTGGPERGGRVVWQAHCKVESPWRGRLLVATSTALRATLDGREVHPAPWSGGGAAQAEAHLQPGWHRLLVEVEVHPGAVPWLRVEFAGETSAPACAEWRPSSQAPLGTATLSPVIPAWKALEAEALGQRPRALEGAVGAALVGGLPDPDVAQRLASAWIERWPRSATAWVARARSLKAVGSLPASWAQRVEMAAWRRAVGFADASARAYAGLTRSAAAAGRYRDALWGAAAVEQRAPRTALAREADVRARLAATAPLTITHDLPATLALKVATAHGDLKAALAAQGRLADAAGLDAPLHRARLARLAGDLDRAIAGLRAALAAEPGWPAAEAELGAVLHHRGIFAAAESTPGAHLRRGDLLLSVQDPKASAELLASHVAPNARASWSRDAPLSEAFPVDSDAVWAAFLRWQPPKALAGIMAGAEQIEVLDRLVVFVQPDGSMRLFTHRITQALSVAARDTLGELSLPEGAKLIRARTLNRAGALLAECDNKGDTSFSQFHVGDAIEYYWTAVDRAAVGLDGARPNPAAGLPGRLTVRQWPDPLADGQLSFLFRLRGAPVFRSELIVVPPPDGEVSFTRAGDPPPMERLQFDGRPAYRFRAEGLTPITEEPFAPSIEDVTAVVTIRRALTGDTAPRIWAAKHRASTQPTQALGVLARSLQAAHPDPRERLEAAFAQIVEAVEQTEEGDATSAWVTHAGDRVLVLAALCRAWGFDAELLVARPRGTTDADGVLAFGWPILRVDLEGAAPLYLDPVAVSPRFGRLPWAVVGQQALAIERPGAPRVALPERAVGRWRITLDLQPQGPQRLKGSLRVWTDADDAFRFRQVWDEYPPSDHAMVLSQLLAAVLPGLHVTEVKLLPGAAFEWVAQLTLPAPNDRIERFVVRGIPAALGGGFNPARYAEGATRQQPLDLTALDTTLEVNLHAGEGWSARIPWDSFETERFGVRVEQSVERAGGAVRLRRRIRVPARRLPAADYPAFAAWARSSARRFAKTLSLVHPSGEEASDGANLR